MLSELRRRTGCGLSKCREASKMFDTIDEAEHWLLEMNKREGAARMKLALKTSVHGAVGLKISNREAVMARVNCQTDFVANSTEFKSLTSSVTSFLSEHLSESSDVIVSGEKIASDKRYAPLMDLLSVESGKFKETFSISDAVVLRSPQNTKYPVVIGHYVHGEVHSYNAYKKGSVGSQAAVVLLSDSTKSIRNDHARSVANLIAQHIVGLRPSFIIGDGTELPPILEDVSIAGYSFS
ncbi:hypothetical protein ACOME3_000545 [Neoechinorhynchus agilis]